MKIAAALLRGAGYRLDFPRTEFYDRMWELLQSMSPAERELLRGHVDWVEAYDQGERPAASA